MQEKLNKEKVCAEVIREASWSSCGTLVHSVNDVKVWNTGPCRVYGIQISIEESRGISVWRKCLETWRCYGYPESRTRVARRESLYWRRVEYFSKKWMRMIGCGI